MLPLLGSAATVAVGFLAYRGVAQQAQVGKIAQDVALINAQGARLDAQFLRIDKQQLEIDELKQELAACREMQHDTERELLALRKRFGVTDAEQAVD